MKWAFKSVYITNGGIRLGDTSYVDMTSLVKTNNKHWIPITRRHRLVRRLWSQGLIRDLMEDRGLSDRRQNTMKVIPAKRMIWRLWNSRVKLARKGRIYKRRLQGPIRKFRAFSGITTIPITCSRWQIANYPPAAITAIKGGALANTRATPPLIR